MCPWMHCSNNKLKKKTGMSSSLPVMNPDCSNQSIDENRWIIQIRKALDDEDLIQESDTPVSIFTVPKALTQISPESYVPQQVALGPYHRWKPELHEMERYKLFAAKRCQRNGLRIQSLVDDLARLEPMFHACYHKYLNFNSEVLSWMMALDSCFLLEFLQSFAVKEGRTLRSMSHLVDTLGQKSGHNAVLKDVVMVENQIPLFVLRKVVEFQLQSSQKADELLYTMLIAFCKELSPFKTVIQRFPDAHLVLQCAHLLDLLYCSIVPREQRSETEIASLEPEGADRDRGEPMNFQKGLSSIGTGAVSLIKRALISRPFKAIATLPWKILSNLPGMIIIKQVEYLFFADEKGQSTEAVNNQDGACNNSRNNPPLMEEIAIPSITQLSKAGVKFSATSSGISGIRFDEETATLHLTKIALDVNTEVTMRNLVAYEACSSSGPLIFTRYTELMNGIIDTAEDAKIMREQGIVLSHLKCDEDIADLWNGMGKSIRLTKVPFLDKVIEDVNKYYNARWSVRIREFLRIHVLGTWHPVVVFAAALLVFFTSLQMFCSVVHYILLFQRKN